jgi:hypothetical protein
VTDTMTYIEIARQVIQKRAAQNPVTAPAIDAQSESLEDVLNGQAIELWSTEAGRLFLVADETDARGAMERLGASRGEIYTAAEARRIVSVKDPAIVAEIHDWKKRFNGVVREFSVEDPK